MTIYRRGYFGHIIGILQSVFAGFIVGILGYYFIGYYAFILAAIIFVLLMLSVVSEAKQFVALKDKVFIYHEKKNHQEVTLTNDTKFTYRMKKKQAGADDFRIFLDDYNFDCTFLGSYKFQCLTHDIEQIIGKKVIKLKTEVKGE